MSVKLGEAAPNFKAKTTQGDLEFYDYLGESWRIRRILRRYAPLNWVPWQDLSQNSTNAM